MFLHVHLLLCFGAVLCPVICIHVWTTILLISFLCNTYSGCPMSYHHKYCCSEHLHTCPLLKLCNRSVGYTLRDRWVMGFHVLNLIRWCQMPAHNSCTNLSCQKCLRGLISCPSHPQLFSWSPPFVISWGQSGILSFSFVFFGY